MFSKTVFLSSLLFLVSCTHDSISHSIEKQRESDSINELYKDTIFENSQAKQSDTISEIKIYFDHKDVDSLSTSEYISRQSQTSNPLSFAISSYIDGVRRQEADLGFETNNLGVESFEIKVEGRTALIKFISKDLNIEGPEQTLNFTYNISKTAEQFDNIDDVKICINDIYNYQMSFLANEEPVVCPFSF